MNLYCDIAAFRRLYADNQGLDVSDETEALRKLLTASREVDDFCGRPFFEETATLEFEGTGLDRLEIPDLTSLTSLKLDEDTDGTFELTLAVDTDFWLEREGYKDVKAKPSTVVILNRFKGQRSAFLLRPRLVEIVASWGFTDNRETVEGVTATLADATATLMTTNKRGDLAVGQTLLVPADAGGTSEQVYLRDLVGGGGSSPKWTVIRGVNGTTAAAATDKAVTRYTYIPQVVEATAIQAGRLWKRRETAFSTTIANPAMGTIETYRGMDTDAKMLLDPYRKLSW